MNILRNMDALFMEPNYNHIKEDINNCWKLCQKIKTDLGGNGYYLDEYLSKIIEILARFDLNIAGEMANDICWCVRGSCYELCGVKHRKNRSEFFGIVKEYIDDHPIHFNDKHTLSQFYAGNILIEHLDIWTGKVKQDYKDNALSEIDYPVPDNMYNEISSIIGEKRMQELNDALCEAFVFGPIMMAASQQIITRGLQMLNYRDPESCKRIYQLMLQDK